MGHHTSGIRPKYFTEQWDHSKRKLYRFPERRFGFPVSGNEELPPDFLTLTKEKKYVYITSTGPKHD